MADQGPTRNQITGGIYVSAVIQGRDITVQLPPEITAALSGLPAGCPAFTGRDSDLQAVLASLAPKPSRGDGEDGLAGSGAVVVIAISGLAGIGKTELAVQAARIALAEGWFPGGVLFVDLFGYDPARRLDPGQALEGLLRALGVPGDHIPSYAQDQARLYTSILAAYVREGRRILVVIDNASAHDQAKSLLPTDGSTAAIVTSRHTLGMLGARLLDLKVLADQDGVKLLERALNVARPDDTRVIDHPDDATTIAKLCSGLPLALQTVAALLAEDPARPLASMAADLANTSFRLEEMSYVDIAVRAAFDLSYQHLDPQQAQVFRLLPVNPGPEISTEATAILTGLIPTAARHGLEALARAHLVEHGTIYGRWRMHDLVRLFADEHGQARAELDGRAQSFTRLLDHYLTITRAADNHLDPAGADPAGGFPDRQHALAWLDTEYPNLTAAAHAAADSGDHAAIARDLPLELARFLSWRRHFNEWIALGTSAVHAARQLGVGEGPALNNLGIALRNGRRFDDAITALQDAAQIARETGDQNGQAGTLTNLGTTLQEMQRFDDAITALQDAAQIFRETGNRHDQAKALNNLGPVLQEAQRFDDAITALQDAAQIFRETGDRHGEAKALNNLGTVLQDVRRLNDAINAHQHAAQIYRETGDQHSEGTALDNLGIALRRMRRFDWAINAHQQALQICRETGDRHGEAGTLNNLGLALQEMRRMDEAINAYQHAAQIYCETGDQHRESIALANLEAVMRA
jgi:tetratricopeptide (TPR) repeat protein